MVNRLLIVKLIYLSILLTGCHGSVADEGEKTEPPQPSYGKAEDGQVLIRHAGDEWSRWKIGEYLTNNELVFNIKRSAGPVADICPDLIADLKNLNFEFIKPDIVTDDWEDPRLEPYKKKYEKFQYGMGYLAKYGPVTTQLPSWNINVYDVDSDNDGEVEAILYGERTLISGRPGGKLPVSYHIFEENGEWVRGASLGTDPSHRIKNPKDYVFSALITIKKIYAVIVVHDVKFAYRMFKVEIDLVGKKDKHLRGSNFKCVFDINNDLSNN